MGCLCSKNVQAVLLGPPGCGKTQLLTRLRDWDEDAAGKANKDFALDHFCGKDLHVLGWSALGLKQNVGFVCSDLYFRSADAVLFMVDADARDTWGVAVMALQELIADERLQNVPFVVLINKLDLRNTSVEEAIGAMGLDQIECAPTQTLVAFGTSAMAIDWERSAEYGFEQVVAWLKVHARGKLVRMHEW